MAVQRTFANATPPYNVELMLQGVLGDVIARIDTDQDGRFEDWLGFLESFGGWDVHLVALCQAAGRADIQTPVQAVAWIQSRPKAEVEAVLKAAWNALLKELAALVNKYWKRTAGAPVADNGATFREPEEVFAYLMAKTVHSEDAEGKAVLTLP